MLAIAETLVNAFCHALGFRGHDRNPRVDVFQLAGRVGAELVMLPELTEDGRVEETRYATRILLHTDPADERQRFTLGHELGHLVLSDPKVFRLVRPEMKVDRLQVEQLCNAFSAELLMPRKWVVKRYGENDEDLDLLDDLAQVAEVSYAAGHTRLSSVLGWKSTLIYLQRNRDWAPFVIGGRHRLREVELDKRTSRLLWDLYRTDETQHRPIDMRIDGRPERVECDLRPTLSGMLCLVHAKERRGGRH